MKSKKKSSSLTYQYVIIFGILLAIANLLLGVVLIQRSTATVRSLIRKNMLDISNTAAGLINGDDLASLTPESVGSPVYNTILKELSVFQNNVDIEYIYAVREKGDGTFMFTVDADPEEPAEFGEEVLITNALIQASKGISTVDDAPAADEWGNFYSSYSPVFASDGSIAGIIGVDFDSEWYENQIRSNTVLVLIISVLFVVVGILVFVLISRRLQKRFTALNAEILTLGADVDSLTKALTSDQGYLSSLSDRRKSSHQETDHISESELYGQGGISGRDRNVPGLPAEAEDPARIPAGSDEIEELSCKIRAMHREMKRYLDYAQERAVTDALTNVSNTTAYLGLQERLEKEIKDGTADFALAVFDINDLKIANDRHGHVYGDRIIHNAANAIASVFGVRNTFRIGGDELLAAAYHKSREEMTALIAKVDAAVAASNETPAAPGLTLSISKGISVFDPGKDTCFKDVFVRADEAMYADKQAFHVGRS